MRLRLLTWHVDSHYLHYLARLPHEFFLPVRPGRPRGYHGRTGPWQWPDNVHEVPVEDVKRLALDCVLFQAREHYLEDQHRLLSAEQRRLPKVYLEHQPPLEHPTEERHPVDDPDTLLVHVSHWNAAMWSNGRSPVRVIEPGVQVPESVFYSGKSTRGVAVAPDLASGGRRAGLDLFQTACREVPIDLVGADARAAGGLGEVPGPLLPEFLSAYRFYFEPSRSGSLSLILCEAMAVGLPVVAFAGGEVATAVRCGVSGHVDTNLRALVMRMRELLASPGEAWRLGQGARRAARERFDLRRFVRDWDHALRAIAGPSRFVAPWGTAPAAGA